jgi:hypothetical protein
MSEDPGVDLGGSAAEGAGLHVEVEKKPEKKLLRSAVVEGMLPSTVTDQIDAGITNPLLDLPWYWYVLGAGASMLSLYALYRLLRDVAIPIGVPLAFGGEVGTAMALERLMRMSDTGKYPIQPAQSGSDEDMTPTLHRAPRSAARAEALPRVPRSVAPAEVDDEAPTPVMSRHTHRFDETLRSAVPAAHGWTPPAEVDDDEALTQLPPSRPAANNRRPAGADQTLVSRVAPRR